MVFSFACSCKGVSLTSWESPSGTHDKGRRDAGGACHARGQEGWRLLGTQPAVCPQPSHTGAFIRWHIHAPEAAHRMSLAQPGFVQSLAWGQAVVIS